MANSQPNDPDNDTMQVYTGVSGRDKSWYSYLPGSKMKCNALECLLKIQAQKGVANEKVPSINSMGKNKDSDVKAIGVLINEDCRSA